MVRVMHVQVQGNTCHLLQNITDDLQPIENTAYWMVRIQLYYMLVLALTVITYIVQNHCLPYSVLKT